MAIQLPNPQQTSEFDVSYQGQQGNQTIAYNSDCWSIQANTNGFTCSDCTAMTCPTCLNGFPFPYSQPGDGGWVQFVYRNWGDNSGGGQASPDLCVWNVEAQCVNRDPKQDWHSGYKSYCVSPFNTGTVNPLTGPGSSEEVYEVVGTLNAEVSRTPRRTASAPTGAFCG